MVYELPYYFNTFQTFDFYFNCIDCEQLYKTQFFFNKKDFVGCNKCLSFENKLNNYSDKSEIIFFNNFFKENSKILTNTYIVFF